MVRRAKELLERPWAARVAWTVFALALFIGLRALWIAQTMALRGRFHFDDVYVTLRYAENLARHGHLSYNLDDRVDGYTSPGWTLLLAAVIRAGGDGARWAASFSWGSGLCAALAAVTLAIRWRAHVAMAVALAGVATLCTPGFAVWSTPGMETPFAALWAVLALLAFTSESRGDDRAGRLTRVGSAFVLVACALARPECTLLASALLACEFGFVVAAARRDGWRTAIRRERAAVVVAVVFVALFAAHWAYYGYPLPNTYYFKRGSDLMARRGRRDVAEFLTSTGLWLAPVAAIALAAVGAMHARARVALVVFALWFYVTCRTYAASGGDYVGFHRFYQPLVPAAWAVIAVAVGRGLEAGANAGLRATTVSMHAALVVTAWGAATFVHHANRETVARALERDAGEIQLATNFANAWQRVGFALRRTYPADTRMAIRAAGVIPFVTRFPTYDVLGLNTIEVAHGPIVRHYPGHQREATARQVLAWRPDIVVHHPDLQSEDLTGRPENATLTDPAYARAGYVYRCIPIDAGQWVCLWERPGARRLR